MIYPTSLLSRACCPSPARSASGRRARGARLVDPLTPPQGSRRPISGQRDDVFACLLLARLADTHAAQRWGADPFPRTLIRILFPSRGGGHSGGRYLPAAEPPDDAWLPCQARRRTGGDGSPAQRRIGACLCDASSIPVVEPCAQPGRGNGLVPACIYRTGVQPQGRGLQSVANGLGGYRNAAKGSGDEMATPRMVAPLLEEEMLEFELLLRKGLDHDELLRIFRKLRKRTERRNGALKASADLHRYGYVTPLTLREYPWLAGTLTVPPHEEDNDEAA